MRPARVPRRVLRLISGHFHAELPCRSSERFQLIEINVIRLTRHDVRASGVQPGAPMIEEFSKAGAEAVVPKPTGQVALAGGDPRARIGPRRPQLESLPHTPLLLTPL